jgi:hypothetical protein
VSIAGVAHAFEVRDTWPLQLGGRVLSQVKVDRGSSPYAWDFTSRSLADRTRLMLYLRAGEERYGTLWLKGIGVWSLSQGDVERVPFEFRQGDYFWERAKETWHFQGRAFVNERRYFTGEHGGVIMYDDNLEHYETFGGVRLDGRTGEFRATAIGSGLEDGAGATRGIGYGRAGWEGGHVQVSGSYLYDGPARDSLDAHHVTKAEVSGFFRGATAIVSYETSSFGDVADASYDWSSWNGSNTSEALPDNAAAFAGLRISGLPAPSWATLDLIARYRAVGSEFYNDLGRDLPGLVNSRVGLYLAHRRTAVNARLMYRRADMRLPGGSDREWVEGSLRGIFTNNVDAFLRGAVAKIDDPVEGTGNEGYVHAGFRRNLRKFTGGLYAMGLRGAGGVTSTRWGAEMRVNISAGTAFYARLVDNEAAASNDGVFVRIEYRPVLHVFAVFSYGRNWIGDGPYMLEDRDITESGAADNVYSVSVRGDF